ncbi:MAG: hypothetical protein AB8B53_01830 [Flavobacteriales bacterium]
MNKRKRNTSKSTFQNFSKTVQFIIGCILILYFLVNKFQSVRTDTITETRDSEIISDTEIYRSLAWADYSRSVYDLDYTIGVNELRNSKSKKDNIRLSVSAWSTNETYWAAVYQQLLSNDKEFIICRADSLEVVRNQEQLNTKEFADVIMTFVQDIEYAFVFEDRQCYKEPRTPCVEGQKFGIHSPTEFLYTLQGDCDTRAVLLMGIYKHLGYDPAIAVSAEYRHAMLLLNLPSSGTYLNHFGKKYFFWESTAKNWKLGIMPPATKNLNHWKIVL